MATIHGFEYDYSEPLKDKTGEQYHFNHCNFKGCSNLSADMDNIINIKNFENDGCMGGPLVNETIPDGVYFLNYFDGIRTRCVPAIDAAYAKTSEPCIATEGYSSNIYYYYDSNDTSVPHITFTTDFNGSNIKLIIPNKGIHYTHLFADKYVHVGETFKFKVEVPGYYRIGMTDIKRSYVQDGLMDMSISTIGWIWQGWDADNQTWWYPNTATREELYFDWNAGAIKTHTIYDPGVSLPKGATITFRGSNYKDRGWWTDYKPEVARCIVNFVTGTAGTYNG